MTLQNPTEFNLTKNCLDWFATQSKNANKISAIGLHLSGAVAALIATTCEAIGQIAATITKLAAGIFVSSGNLAYNYKTGSDHPLTRDWGLQAAGKHFYQAGKYTLGILVIPCITLVPGPEMAQTWYVGKLATPPPPLDKPTPVTTSNSPPAAVTTPVAPFIPRTGTIPPLPPPMPTGGIRSTVRAPQPPRSSSAQSVRLADTNTRTGPAINMDELAAKLALRKVDPEAEITSTPVPNIVTSSNSNPAPTPAKVTLGITQPPPPPLMPAGGIRLTARAPQQPASSVQIKPAQPTQSTKSASANTSRSSGVDMNELAKALAKRNTTLN